MSGILIAIISGALMSIQGVFNTGVTRQTSIWTATSFVQLTALLASLVAWFVSGNQAPFGSLFKIDGKYMLLGGIIGAGITYTVVQSVAALGPAKSAMLVVTAQLLVSYLIQLFGLFGTEKAPFEWRKLLGLGLAIAGILIFQYEKS
ncbi:MAG: DMT family transporter [Lachnospiraceae bacterium]|nr:DMT family transporter [Lachnospiraceae bacterium]